MQILKKNICWKLKIFTGIVQDQSYNFEDFRDLTDMPLFWWWFRPESRLEPILKLSRSSLKIYLNIDFLNLTIIQVDHEINES